MNPSPSATSSPASPQQSRRVRRRDESGVVPRGPCRHRHGFQLQRLRRSPIQAGAHNSAPSRHLSIGIVADLRFVRHAHPAVAEIASQKSSSRRSSDPPQRSAIAAAAERAIASKSSESTLSPSPLHRLHHHPATRRTSPRDTPMRRPGE